MSTPSDHTPHVRRVVLPSGKSIEVVLFEEPAPPPLPGGHTTALHLCPSCDGRLVYPVAWEEAGPAHWEVLLRCPDCELLRTGVYAEDEVERFDEELDRGTEVLVRDLRQITRANMEEELERFVTALRHDHLLPEDF